MRCQQQPAAKQHMVRQPSSASVGRSLLTAGISAASARSPTVLWSLCRRSSSPSTQGSGSSSSSTYTYCGNSNSDSSSSFDRAPSSAKREISQHVKTISSSGDGSSSSRDSSQRRWLASSSTAVDVWLVKKPEEVFDGIWQLV